MILIIPHHNFLLFVKLLLSGFFEKVVYNEHIQ
jgi:hypothetical protein